MNYVSAEEWRAKSPDTAHMDYCFGGILTRELQKKSKRTLAGHKRILKLAWNDPIQDVFHSTLHSWPKRCRLIYYKHRSHIKHVLKLEACKLYGYSFIAK